MKYKIFSVLNYQGSKRNLTDFIVDNILVETPKEGAVLDIFSGSGMVAYALKGHVKVYSNDIEAYSQVISEALLSNTNEFNFVEIDFFIRKKYEENFGLQYSKICDFIKEEDSLIQGNDVVGLLAFYGNYPTVWNNLFSSLIESKLNVSRLRSISGLFVLFTTYFAGSYFGIRQALEIDSLVYAIKQCENEKVIPLLYSSLYFAMKECIFSKDGHMAQPLNIEKNFKKLRKIRNKSIYDSFNKKFREFFSGYFDNSLNDGRSFKRDFNDLINKDFPKDVKLIYADPPYTDMQYSRYYHLLNVVTDYNYPELVEHKGSYTKGLYTEGRNVSSLSHKSYALKGMEVLMHFCMENKIKLIISFAYPRDCNLQCNNRYVFSIDDLIDVAKRKFDGKVKIKEQLYSHANNRNSEHKKVIEYLVICG